MTVWDEVKLVISRLRDQQPGALMSYPSPEALTDRTLPFDIRLAPWAADTAEEFRRQFGDDVELTVGYLPYPPGRPRQRRDTPGQLPDLLDPREVTVVLDSPAIVSSGHTLRHELTVHNLTGDELQIETNGQVTATVVDPQTGEAVGGYPGAQTLKLKVFRAPAGGSTRIPLLIGTASRVSRLGYTVPPGEWGIRAVLTFGSHLAELTLGSAPGNSTRRRTPILPLTITA